MRLTLRGIKMGRRSGYGQRDATARLPDQPPVGHVPYLDGWRGMAIICVLIAHFATLGQLGGFGVSIFFVLSGVLMSRILFIEKMPLGTFYRRRAARILPVFFLYVLVVFGGGWFFLNTFNLVEMVSTLVFLRTYFPDPPIFQSAIPIAHIWSLNVEEHCYVLLSVVSLLAIRYGAVAIRIVLATGAVLCLFFFFFYKYHPPASHALFTLRSEVAAFPLLLSCALFMWFQKYPRDVPAVVPVVSFAIALLVAIFSRSVFLSFFLVSVFLAISVNTLHSAPAWVLKKLSNPVITWFGTCSYSIYLWQQLFYFGAPYAKGWDYYGVFSLVSTLLVASVSFYFFENPVRKWLAGTSRGRLRPRDAHDPAREPAVLGARPLP